MDFKKVTSKRRMGYFSLLATAIVLQINTESTGALQGNCRLFGCGKVVKFDLHTETCCGGTVYIKDLDENGNEKTKCCYGSNSAMYDVETQECCGGKVIWKSSSTEGCCDGKTFDKNVDTCCEGKIKNKKLCPCCGNDPVDLSLGIQCCGGEKYNSREKTCCNDNLVNALGECCGDSVANPANDKCCRHNGSTKLHKNYNVGSTCCGLKTYQPEEQLCCKSVVHDKIDHVIECCGNTTFNIMTEVCCQGRVLPRKPGKKSCCGDQLYDEDDEICCRGRVKCCDEESYQEEKEVCISDLFLNESVPTIDGIVRHLKNSTVAYLSANQFECGSKLITRSREKNACCNQTAYNSADHLCCEVSGSSSELVLKSPSRDMCCGRMSYDSNIQGCCNFDQGVNRNQVYDLENEICNKDGVHPRYGNIEAAQPCVKNKLDKDKMCKIEGNEEIPYNSASSVCTPRGVVAVPDGMDICGNNTFKKDLFICCRGKIFPKEVEDGVQKCCSNPIDKETFIPAIQTCYYGRITDIPETQASICKGVVYDNTTHECALTGEIRSIEQITQKPNVCWYNETYFTYFNNKTHSCCNGHIINVNFTCCAEDSECCDPGAVEGYNREKQVCCGGVLRLREVTMKKPSNDCRGSQCHHFHESSFLCCQGTPHEHVESELTCGGNLLTGRMRDNGIICRGKIYHNGTDCCGGISYDNQTEICCGGVVADRTNSTTCCGNHIFDSSDDGSLCCESSFYENATGLSCCGGATYNPANETCCTTGNKTYVLPSKDGLCCSNGEDYDDTLHTCCDGLVHKYITNGTCCGNDVIRDPAREGCFNGRIYLL